MYEVTMQFYRNSRNSLISSIDTEKTLLIIELYIYKWPDKATPEKAISLYLIKCILYTQCVFYCKHEFGLGIVEVNAIQKWVNTRFYHCCYKPMMTVQTQFESIIDVLNGLVRFSHQAEYETIVCPQVLSMHAFINTFRPF